MDKKRKIITIVFLAITIALTLTIIINAFFPENVSASMSNSISDEIVKVYTPTDKEKFYTFVRKSLGHFLLNGFNALFASLTVMFFSKGRKLHRGIYLLFALAYSVVVAATSEFIQIFVDGRGATWKDVLINSAGCLLFAFIVGLVYSIKFYVHEKKTA